MICRSSVKFTESEHQTQCKGTIRIFGKAFEQGPQNLGFCSWSVGLDWRSRICLKLQEKFNCSSGWRRSKWCDNLSDDCTWNSICNRSILWERTKKFLWFFPWLSHAEAHFCQLFISTAWSYTSQLWCCCQRYITFLSWGRSAGQECHF